MTETYEFHILELRYIRSAMNDSVSYLLRSVDGQGEKPFSMFAA